LACVGQIPSVTICLSYKLLKSSIPAAWSFKLIGAAMNVWPLKETPEGVCLYHQAAILCIDRANDLHISVKDNKIIIYLINKDTKRFIPPNIASKNIKKIKNKKMKINGHQNLHCQISRKVETLFCVYSYSYMSIPALFFLLELIYNISRLITFLSECYNITKYVLIIGKT
jgi:hypothetical protein